MTTRWPLRIGVRIVRIALLALVAGGVTIAKGDPIGTVWYASYAAVGTLLAIRRPRNPIGGLLIVIGAILATQDNSNESIAAVVHGTADPLTTLGVWFGSWSGAGGYVGYLALAIIFPSGRFPVGRWRRPAFVAMAMALGTLLLMAFAPMIGVGDGAIQNPFPLLSWLPGWDILYAIGPFPVLLALLGMSVGSQVVRYRRATGVIRQQLRWLVSAVVFMVVGLVFGLSISAFSTDPGGNQWLVVAASFPLIPIAIGIAVLRYRLYAIDRIISRTLAYASVIAILGTAFVAIILALQSVLSLVTQGQTVAVAASTLVVFALFQPVLRRVRAAVDRRFDRARYDADLTVQTFAARLRGDIDLGTVSTEIIGTASAAVRPTKAGVWLRRTPPPARPAS